MNKTKEEIQYEPFGDEWKKEINKIPKGLIIDMLSKKGKEYNALTDQIKSMENLENKVKEYEELMMDLEDSYMDWIDAEGTQNDGRFSVEVNNIRIKAKALTN